MPKSSPTLDTVLSRTGGLYSLPAVATEVLRLTDQPQTDARAIRDCLERDPALSAKLLRVVNSSLYGLSGKVATLDQAIALLGVTPLRLLVLGFSLPDRLLESLTGDALERYWTETLTRAAAARAIAQLGWDRLGDEAFVAGMMQGIGQLVLLQQLNESYSQLLKKYADSPCLISTDLATLEAEALGFDHRTLSAGLMRQWNLPEVTARAIEVQTDVGSIGRLCQDRDGDAACLAQSLRLAELMTRLVCQKRLSALPALVEEGSAYCGLTQRQINSLVEPLQERVDQVAAAMSAPLAEGRDYQQTLLSAHAQISLVAEAAAARLLGADATGEETDNDQRLVDELLTETHRLSASMRAFLHGNDPTENRPAHAGRAQPRRPHRPSSDGLERFAASVTRLAAECRSGRTPLSVVLIGIDTEPGEGETPIDGLRCWLAESPWAQDAENGVWASLGPCRAAVALAGADRLDATQLWSEVTTHYSNDSGMTINAGVAGVALVPKGFEPQRLIEPAGRCLEAAIATAGSSIKGIEVY